MVFFGITLGMGCLCTATEKGYGYHWSMRETDINMMKIKSAVQYYSALHLSYRDNSCPASLEELLQFASINEYMKKDAPLRKEDLIDRWGEPIQYETDGRWYIIRSSGRDKVMGTADDIIMGNSSVYLDEARQKAKQTPALTNAVQAVAQSGGATSPSLLKRWLGKRNGAVPEEGRATASPLSRLWFYVLIPLCLLGAVAAWRYFRKRKRE